MALPELTGPLNHEQLKALSTRLLGTSRNIYQLTRTLYDVEADDNVFDDLKAHYDLFKCELCGVWTSVEDDRTPDMVSDICLDCIFDDDLDEEDED